MAVFRAALFFVGVIVVAADNATTTTIATTPITTTFQAKRMIMREIVGKLGVAVENTGFIMDGGSNQAGFALGVQRSIADVGNIADENMVVVTLTTARRLQTLRRQLQAGTIQADYTVTLPESMGSVALSSIVSALKSASATSLTSTLAAKLRTIMGADAPDVVVSIIDVPADVPTHDISETSTTSLELQPAYSGAQKGNHASMYAFVMACLVASWLV